MGPVHEASFTIGGSASGRRPHHPPRPTQPCGHGEASHTSAFASSEGGCGNAGEPIAKFSLRTRLDSRRSQGSLNKAQRDVGINMLHHDLNKARAIRNECICMSRNGNRAAVLDPPIVRGLKIARERPIGIFGPDFSQLGDGASQMRVRYCSSSRGIRTASASSTKILQKPFKLTPVRLHGDRDPSSVKSRSEGAKARFRSAPESRRGGHLQLCE